MNIFKCKMCGGALKIPNNQTVVTCENCGTKQTLPQLEAIYNRASAVMSIGATQAAYLEAAQLFSSIPEYKNAAELAKRCYDLAEEKRKEVIYYNALGIAQSNTVQGYEEALRLFAAIPGWRDADKNAEICRWNLAQIQAQEAAVRLAMEQQAEHQRQEDRRKAKQRKKTALIVTSILVVVIAAFFLLTKVIIPNNQYNDALALMEAGEYAKAIDYFEELDGYRDSEEKIQQCHTAILDGRYRNACAMMDDGRYEEAIAAFEALDGYRDSASKISQCRYQQATALMNAGELDEAYAIFQQLGNYKDAAKWLDEIDLRKLKTANVGGYVKFGTYEQDNVSNGQEKIEWIVLARQGNRVLLISRYALDCQPYHTDYTDVTWETCTLRKWLNNAFINTAFSPEEKAMIPVVTVSADKNPEYNTKPGKATQDRVFLLSVPEASQYFSADLSRMCKPTDYAFARGVATSGAYGYCMWWLRSPSNAQSVAAIVNGGGVGAYGSFVSSRDVAVRPAIWVVIE